MSPKNKRLRHSDSSLHKTFQNSTSKKPLAFSKKSTTANSSTKSPRSPKSPKSQKKKKYDVEPAKKRLRSASDYKLSSAFDDPEQAFRSSTSRQSLPIKKHSPMKSAQKRSPLDKKRSSPDKKRSSPDKKRSSPDKKKFSPTKREPFSPEARTPSPQRPASHKKSSSSSSKKFKSEATDKKKKITRRSSSTHTKKEAETSTSSIRRLTTIKLELPDTLTSNVTPNLPKTPRTSIRFFEPDTPPVRNQNVFYNCAVCKEPTLLLSAEYREQLLKNEVKNIELNADDLTPGEDPALQCNSCNRHFHLVCVFDELQLQNWALSYPKSFVCQECVRCSRCYEPIFDPGNVQCITCGNTYHEICKPETQIIHDFPSLSRIWYCHVCEENLLDILDIKRSLQHSINAEEEPQPSSSKQSVQKRPAKRSLNQLIENSKGKKTSRRSDPNKSIKSPPQKRAKIEQSDASSPSRTLRRLSSRTNPETPSPVKSSPKSSKLSHNESPNKLTKKELTDEEQEKRRASALNRLKESIRYDGEFQCIAAQESIFSRLNEEYPDEEEELNEPKIEQYIPFASVGGGTSSKRGDPKDLTFFYGPIAYRPRFSKFLHLIYPEYNRLSFCRRCLMAFSSPSALLEHNSACTVRNPPGTLIYQEKNISVWEIVGSKEKTYCRRLALFAKTFIGSKTVFFEVEQFNFYVLTETEDSASIMVGYFSKEIKPTANNNLSCLLILPWVQRKGYGLFLIDLSYHLSLRERKIGSPEHPLSDAGLKTYRQYWYGTIMSFLREKIYNKEKIDLIELKEEKGIDIRDILETLIISDMTFILDNNLHINVEIPLYTMLSSLRRRYVKPKLLQVKSYAGPFTTYNL